MSRAKFHGIDDLVAAAPMLILNRIAPGRSFPLRISRVENTVIVDKGPAIDAQLYRRYGLGNDRSSTAINISANTVIIQIIVVVQRARIAGVSDPVPVGILLHWIGNAGTVIGIIRYLISIRVDKNHWQHT